MSYLKLLEPGNLKPAPHKRCNEKTLNNLKLLENFNFNKTNFCD